MNRIYHRFEKWECYKNGFFKNTTKKNNDELKGFVIELFNDSYLTEIYMRKVIDEWFFSCEHNLSNISMNRVAWLGQAACCIYKQIPYQITMNTWRFVDKDAQLKACEIAEKIIKEYEVNQYKKNQLCLKFI